MKRLIMLSLLVGCGGTETGNPVRDPGENTGGANCEAVSSEAVELTSPTSLGFSASTVLAYAGGQHTQALTWQTLRFGSYGPESGAQTLTLGVSARGAKLVQYASKGGAEILLAGGAQCSPQLEIDADVTLQSSGGALNESVRATLVASRVEVATLNVRFDPNELKGTLEVTPPMGEGWTTTAVQLGVQFTQYSLSGSLQPEFEQRTKDSVGMSAGSGPLATFGLTPCAYGVAVPLDATGAASSASTLALLGQHGTASIGGNSATLTFEPSGDACKYFGDSYSPEPNAVLTIPGTLVVKTSTLDGRWPVELRTNPDANGQLTGPVAVQLDSQSPSSLASLGFTQIDTSGYDSTSAQLMLSLVAGGWSGSVELYGYKNANCPQAEPGSNSSPGCPGADRSVLAHLEVN